NFHNYFVLEFDKDFELTHTWGDHWQLQPGSTSSEGGHVGAIIGFKTQKGEQVHVRVASSFISPQQAELNLQRELAQDSFDQTRAKARAGWQTELNKIRLDDQDLDQVRTFYSTLYRVLLFP